jgi:GNAT superfamily N-acetyltransferase
MTAPPVTEPRHRTVRFPDGATIELRPIGIRDGRLVSSFLTQLSPGSEYRRFLSEGGGMRSRWVANLINADQVDSLVYGAVADNGSGSSLVAVGESIRLRDDRERAEFALAAIDPWQNMGIGSLLADYLARLARDGGVRYWESHMLADNGLMTSVLARVGTQVSYSINSGLASVLHRLDPN